MKMKENLDFMQIAIDEAKKALKKDEVPIGACIVKDGKIISKGYNKREKSKNALNHAEIIAINKACKKLKDWRLSDCEMYVTLKPCPMCAGAIVNARIKVCHFGADETNSQDNLCEQIFESTRLNHKTVLKKEEKYSQECSSLLTTFFKSKRK